MRRRVIVFKWPRVKNRRRPTVTRAANSDTSLPPSPPSPNSNVSRLRTRFVLYAARCAYSQVRFSYFPIRRIFVSAIVGSTRDQGYSRIEILPRHDFSVKIKFRE